MSDWETVTILRKKPPKPSQLKSEQVFQLRLSRSVSEFFPFLLFQNLHQINYPNSLTSSLKMTDFRKLSGQPILEGGGGQNKQHATVKNTAKLDRETEELKHDTVPLDVGKLIQQGRQAKGWSQKDLATRINEKPQVIQEYEAARGIPNQTVISKIERALGMKLRGKDRGKPMAPPGKK
ncbi:unnamed protein product [Bemisia tabaci]|uniref:HTH cro/C1-type domain-containing protein n=1 Tax=Bemisia tabaci TaxID=7038 RepID=A0A9P0AA91_BEMTA|nr:unnamed protein product [Bemisia tabaci]